MTAAEIAAIVTAAVSLAGAATAWLHASASRRQVSAYIHQQNLTATSSARPTNPDKAVS